MIIGNGDIASVLIDRNDLLFFVSGVSNSQEIRESEYNREIKLLKQQDFKKHIVYVSSLAVFYNLNRYVRHKMLMEDLIKDYFPHHTILRIGNITWGTNPHTLINFFKNKVKKGETLEIQDVYRYIVEKEEFLYWVSMIPNWNCEMNITGKRMLVKDIVKEYVYEN